MHFARRYFYLIAGVTFFLGLGLLFLPNLALDFFFEETAKETGFFVRIAGSTLIGYAALNFFTAREHNKRMYVVASWANMMTLLIATILSALFIADFDHNNYLLLFQHSLFALGFLYIIYKLR